jgi:hypothetical protein
VERFRMRLELTAQDCRQVDRNPNQFLKGVLRGLGNPVNSVSPADGSKPLSCADGTRNPPRGGPIVIVCHWEHLRDRRFCNYEYKCRRAPKKRG